MTGRGHPLDRNPGLAALARVQCGVVSRKQLASLEITRHHLRRQVEAQRWRMVGGRVVVLHTGPLTRHQMYWVAVLHAGPAAKIAGLTALELSGLRGWARDDLHVLVPFGQRVPPLARLVVHTTRIDVSGCPLVGSGPMATSVPRSTIDAARWEPTPRRAAALVLAVVQQRLARPPALAAELKLLGPITHAAEILAAVNDATDGADSLAEVEVSRLVVRAGLPTPRRQMVIETPDGPRPVDLVVDLPDGSRLVIEVDGPHHADPSVRLADSVKDAALIAAGYLVLRVPVAALRADPGAVLRQLVSIREAAARRAAPAPSGVSRNAS